MMPTVGLMGEQGMIPCRIRADVINWSVGRISTMLEEMALRIMFRT